MVAISAVEPSLNRSLLEAKFLGLGLQMEAEMMEKLLGRRLNYDGLMGWRGKSVFRELMGEVVGAV